MVSIKNKNRNFLQILPVILLAGMIIGPILGTPVPVVGIPIWYQDPFMFGCIMLSIAGGIAFIGLLSGAFPPFRWNYIDGAILVLLAYILIRTWSMDFTPQSSWAQIIFLAGAYYTARILWSVLDSRRVQQLLVIVLTIGILEAILGLGQLYGWWPSNHDLFAITGTFPNPGPYSGWLACLIPIAIYGILRDDSISRGGVLQSISWIYLALACLVLVPAASRAAILASGVASVVVAWPKVKNWAIWNKAWLKGGVAVGILLGMLALYLIKKDSADGRWLIYKVTANMIAEAPVVGWGWDGFSKMYNNYQSEYFTQGLGSEREKYLADNVLYGFNELLKFTTEMGTVGLVLLAGIFFLFLRKWRSQIQDSGLLPIHYLAMGVVSAWCVFGLFSYPLSIPGLGIILPIAAAGLNTGLSQKRKDEILSDSRNYTLDRISKKIISPMLIAGLSGFLIYWVVQYKPVVRKWVEANIHQDQKRYEPAIVLYRELYPRLDHEGWFLQYAGKSLSLNQQYDESAQMLERALNFSSDPATFTTLGLDYTLHAQNPSDLSRAESLLSHVKYMSPYKYYPRYLLAQHYFHTDQIEKAVGEAEEAMKIVPKIASPATNDMRLTMKRLVENQTFEPEKTQVLRDNE